MAEIYLKINHQEIDFYVSWDTIFDLPITVPMDLATFVVYLNDTNISFNGFIASWINLKSSNISLDQTSVDQFLKPMEIRYLCLQSEDQYISNSAKNNSNLSDLVFTKLDSLIAEQHNSSSEITLVDKVLNDLSRDFKIFIGNSISNQIALLPMLFYQNISELNDKIQNQITLEKKEDFRKFMFNPSNPEKSQVEWYSKLLYSKNIQWHHIPISIRASFLFTDTKIQHGINKPSPFLRNIHNVQINKYSPTRLDLLAYYNHLLGEKYFFAIELKNYLDELGFIDETNLLTLANLNYLIDTELLNSEYHLPDELVNFFGDDGGKLLPSIYDGFFQKNGLYIFYKYKIQLFDVYTNMGDLVFSNLEDIDVFILDNDIVVSYETEQGFRFYKKVIIQIGKPIQIVNIPPFEYPSDNFE